MDLFPLKAAAGVCLLSLEQHALMFLAFSLLVAMDCLSRWLAISAGMLKEKSGEIPPLLLSLLSIPEARRKGLISSKVMKEAGLSKLFLYNICVIAAGLGDYLLSSAGSPSAIAVSYLSSAEALSVTENLSEAGVKSMAGLLELFRKKES